MVYFPFHLVRETRVVFQHVHQAEVGLKHQRGHQRRPCPLAPLAPPDALAGFQRGCGATTHDGGGSGRSLEEVVVSGGRVELPEMAILGLPVVRLVVGADDAHLASKGNINNAKQG